MKWKVMFMQKLVHKSLQKLLFVIAQLETTEMSWVINKQTEAYPHNRVIPSDYNNELFINARMYTNLK